MTRVQRAAVVLFMLVYNAFVPGFSEVIHQPSLPLAAARFASELIYQLLLVFPFIYFKPGFGWLHPLIFTVLWPLAQSVVSEPGQLLSPLTVFLGPMHPEGGHAALRGFSEQAEAWTMVKAKGIQSLSLVAYYTGFFSGLRPSVPILNFRKPKQLPLRTMLLVGGAFGVFFLAAQMRGGIARHFASLGLGRQSAIGGLGHIGVLIRLGVIASIVWYAFDPDAGMNPLYWGTLATSLVSIFLWSGSRSDVIFPLAFLLILRALRTKRLPWSRGLALGATALVLFGMLGALRASTITGRPAWDLVTELQVGVALEFADEQLDRREENQGGGYTAVVGRVPRDVDFLYGRTYLGAALFFVPRAIWENKPRATGPYVNKYLYGTTGRVEVADSPPLVGGVPPGPVGAAYWNFYVPGVVILFSLLGIFHRWLARFYRQNENPLGAVLFVHLVVGAGVSPNALVSLFQDIILLLGVLTIVGAIRPFQTLRRRIA
jgi:hypothetical protein